MHGSLGEEFKEFEVVARPYAECFLNEHIDLIEQKAGFHRKNFDLEKLTMVYVMYEYVRHKEAQGKPINEMILLNALRSARKTEYISALRDYSNKCGKMCGITHSNFNLVCNMARISKHDVEEKGVTFSQDNIIVLSGEEY